MAQIASIALAFLMCASLSFGQGSAQGCVCACGRQVENKDCNEEGCKKACAGQPDKSWMIPKPAVSAVGLDQELLNKASRGLTGDVEGLLRSGANIEAKSGSDGATALIGAAAWGHAETVKLLLSKGANIEAVENDGVTALMRAAQQNRIDVVKLILDRGASINARDARGNTALMYAASQSSDGTEIVKLLLQKGADPEAKDDRGKTALLLAAHQGTIDVLKLLLASGAKVDAKDNLGFTALALATLELEQCKRFSADRPERWAAELAAATERVRLLQQATSNDPRVQLSEYAGAVQRRPWDDAAREELIQFANSIPGKPAVPEEARQAFLQALALMKQSSKPAELAKPIELLQKALGIAPWWGDAYYNLARALELSGRYDDATKQLNYYLALKPSEADAADARTRLAVIQAEKEAAAQRQLDNESVLAMKYVSGGITRLRYVEGPAWWKPPSGYGVGYLYGYEIPEEAPFYLNVFRFPNQHLVAITLEAISSNGMYGGDLIRVMDVTNQSCIEGFSFAFGADSYTHPCGVRYDVRVSAPPNATVTVKDPVTGATVTLPVALLYRARPLKAGWGGKMYQGGVKVMVLEFESTVVTAARNPEVNAMGLVPKSVTPYEKGKD